MKVLVLSYYYSPDLSAGSFRNTALVNELANKLSENDRVDVITTLPSRYSSYTVEASAEEVYGNVKIYRISLPNHANGMLDQSIAYIKYASEVIRLSRLEKYDVVYASSGRLMTAFLGALISRKQRVPLYLDIRDIFVDTIKDVLSKPLSLILKPFFSIIERFTISTANRVNLVSRGFEDYFVKRYPGKQFSYYSNGIDQEFLDYKPNIAGSSSGAKVSVVYAGNIGAGQGLELILPELAKYFGEVEFKIYGDGGRAGRLKERLLEKNIQNVQVIEPVPRNELVDIYFQADVLFLHLNDYPAFRKVLPSKVFEYGATGKPIWAGVSGYSAKFLEDNVENSAVFSPCSIEEAIIAFNKLVIGPVSREGFNAQFARIKIMNDLAHDILDIRIKNDLA